MFDLFAERFKYRTYDQCKKKPDISARYQAFMDKYYSGPRSLPSDPLVTLQQKNQILVRFPWGPKVDPEIVVIPPSRTNLNIAFPTIPPLQNDLPPQHFFDLKPPIVPRVKPYSSPSINRTQLTFFGDLGRDPRLICFKLSPAELERLTQLGSAYNPATNVSLFMQNDHWRKMDLYYYLYPDDYFIRNPHTFTASPGGTRILRYNPAY
jgi:hypothetical protein